MNDQTQTAEQHQKARKVLVIGTYDSETKATRAVEELIEKY